MRNSQLTFKAVSDANRARCQRWHPGFPGDDGWTGADWANAMQGEAGEAGNVVKKLRRIETGMLSARADGARAELLQRLADEIGDVYAYLDLLAQFYGLDIEDCIRDKFNAVSVREGMPERIGEQQPTVMADLTPQEALDQFERTTGYRIHAVTDAGGTVWWRQPIAQPMFECTIGDRCLHIDELAAPKPYGPSNPQCPAQDSTGLDCAGPAGHHGDDHANINGPFDTAMGVTRPNGSDGVS